MANKNKPTTPEADKKFIQEVIAEVEAQKAEDLSFVGWLEDTLIPDLKSSGMDCTAEDFERCVAIIRRLHGA